MKNSILLFISLSIVALFSSCQKEDLLDGGSLSHRSKDKVKSYTEEVIVGREQTANTFRLDYDAEGRLTGWVSTTNSGDKYLYKYKHGSYETAFYISGELVQQKTTFLNKSMLIDSTVQGYDATSTISEKYIYNSANQLVTINRYHVRKISGPSLYNSHQYVYDETGNLVMEKDGNSVTTYDYYTNLSSNILIGAPYLQKPNNLVKTTTYVSGGETENFNHTYTFDSNKRLAAEMISKSGSNDKIVRKFFY